MLLEITLSTGDRPLSFPNTTTSADMSYQAAALKSHILRTDYESEWPHPILVAINVLSHCRSKAMQLSDKNELSEPCHKISLLKSISYFSHHVTK